MKAVIYARVSGDDTKTATSSIDAQLIDGRKYAADKGYDVVGEFVEMPDKKTSGADWLPEIDKVVKLAQAGGYEVLIVHKVDRLARNRFKQMSIENNLDYVGARVEYVNGQYDDTPEGRLLKGLVSEFAEFEREMITDRMKRGIVRSVKAGNVTVAGSKSPFGYNLIKADGCRQLEINEAEAAVVRVIFDLYGNKGYSIRKIRDYLDDNGIDKPGKGANHKAKRDKLKKLGLKAAWSTSTLNRIIDNETYIGRWYYRKTKRVKVGDGKYKPVPRPKSEWLMVEVPAIIDDFLFKKAQAKRKTNKRQKRNQQNRFYFLGGMIRCGHCGYSVIGRTNLQNTKHMGRREYGRYMCSVRNTPKRFGFCCDLPFFKMSVVDTVVWDWLRGIIQDPDLLQEALEGYKAQQAERSDPLEGMLEANEAKLVSLEGEKDRLIKAYSAGILSLDEIAEQKNDLDQQIKTLEGAIASLHSELKGKTFTAEEMQTIQSLAAQYQEEVAQIDDNPQEKRRIMQMLGVEVVLSASDGGNKWVDVSCKLGKERCAVPSNKH